MLELGVELQGHHRIIGLDHVEIQEELALGHLKP